MGGGGGISKIVQNCVTSFMDDHNTKIKSYFSLTDETIKTLKVKLGYHNLDCEKDAQSVEKSVQLIIINQNFSLETIVSIDGIKNP